MQLQKQALEAAKQALIGHGDECKEINEALALIDRALAQSEQEPVASIFISGIGEREFDDWGHDLPVGRNLLYTSPPASKLWVELDHDDIHVLMNEFFYPGMQPYGAHFANFAKAIESKLKEKNT